MPTSPTPSPVDLPRVPAREAARDELARPEYREHRGNPVARVLGWIEDRITELLSDIAGGTPGGGVTLTVVVLLVIGAVIALRLRLGPLRPVRPPVAEELFGRERARSADEHRRAADAFAARGRWDEAVTERLRAIVRSLEERAVIDERPGRTADEAAVEAGRALPALAGELRSGARAFDDVRYGGRPATAATDAALRELDARCRTARPVPAAAAAAAPGAFGPPR